MKAELLYKLCNRSCDGVLEYKLDRWARSSIELMLDINELVKMGIAFISNAENYDFSTSTKRLHVQILSAFTGFERDFFQKGLRRTFPGPGIGEKHLEGQKVGNYRLIEDYLNSGQ